MVASWIGSTNFSTVYSRDAGTQEFVVSYNEAAAERSFRHAAHCCRLTDTAKASADIIDTQRSLRLEQIIVVLIALEIVIDEYQILMR